MKRIVLIGFTALAPLLLGGCMEGLFYAGKSGSGGDDRYRSGGIVIFGVPWKAFSEGEDEVASPWVVAGRGSVHELGDYRVSIWEEDLRTVYTIMDASGKVLHDEISAAVFEGAMPGLYAAMADMETATAAAE